VLDTNRNLDSARILREASSENSQPIEHAVGKIVPIRQFVAKSKTTYGDLKHRRHPEFRTQGNAHTRTVRRRFGAFCCKARMFLVSLLLSPPHPPPHNDQQHAHQRYHTATAPATAPADTTARWRGPFVCNATTHPNSLST
jgi:hypothetical protein